MKQCKNCTKRFVGCHSQCQTYVVAKVIHRYKSDKAIREKDLKFNTNRKDHVCSVNMRKLDGFKWVTYKG